MEGGNQPGNAYRLRYPGIAMRDLVVLTACQHSKFAVRAVMARADSLSIRAIDANFVVHPENDPGCFNTAHTLLRSQVDQYRYALVIFDRHGSGQERFAASQIASIVTEHLARNGWTDRAAVVVINPELEAWVWSDSPNVDRILGWEGRLPPLRSWLEETGWIPQGQTFPSDPKGALLSAIRASGVRHSSSLFEALGQSVGLRECADPNFRRLCDILRGWFPAAGT